MKLKFFFLALTSLVCSLSASAIEDLVIYDEGTANERGLLYTALNTGGLNGANLPSFRLNSAKSGINMSDNAFVLQTAANADAWNCYADIYLKDGITPDLIEQRRYLKLMIWKSPNLQNAMIYLRDSETPLASMPKWNEFAKASYYSAISKESTWVDVVIDLKKDRANVDYSDLTVDMMRIFPLSQHGAKPAMVTFRVDKVVLSDNPVPRDQVIMTRSDVKFEFESFATEMADWLKEDIRIQNNLNSYEVVDNPKSGGINTTNQVMKFNKVENCEWYHGGPMFLFNDLVPITSDNKYMHAMIYIPTDEDLSEDPIAQKTIVQLHSSDWTGNVNQAITDFEVTKGVWTDLVQEVNRTGSIPYLRQFSIRYNVGAGDPIIYAKSGAGLFYVDNVQLNSNPDPIVEITTSIDSKELSEPVFRIVSNQGVLSAQNVASAAIVVYNTVGQLVLTLPVKDRVCTFPSAMSKGLYIVKDGASAKKITIQ